MDRSLLVWSLIAGLLSQSLFIPVMCATASFEDQKNYYSPDPHAGSPPAGSPPTGSYGGSPPSHSTPSHGSGTPSHGGSGTPSHGGSGTPSHGGSGRNCGTPSTPSTSPPSGHGGYYPSPDPNTPTPSTPTYNPTPSTPSTPTYSPTPSTPTYNPTPSTPTYNPTPSTPFAPFTPPTPSTPPFLPDPNSPPFTCNYWRNHPGIIWGLLGWWGTMGNAFGVPSVPGFGTNMSLKDALSNSRADGLGQLYREGTASLLNSMVDNHFAFSTKQVRDHFVAALGSNKAASTQARVFKLANEGKLKPRH